METAAEIAWFVAIAIMAGYFAPKMTLCFYGKKRRAEIKEEWRLKEEEEDRKTAMFKLRRRNRRAERLRKREERAK